METRTPLTPYWRDGTRSINYAVQERGLRACGQAEGRVGAQPENYSGSRYKQTATPTNFVIGYTSHGAATMPSNGIATSRITAQQRLPVGVASSLQVAPKVQ